MAKSNKRLQDVLDIIESHKKRVKERKKKWRGTLEEYLELVLENPKLAETAHQRQWRVFFDGPGWIEVKASDNPKLARALDLKDDKSILIPKAWKDNFFGIELTFQALMQYYLGGAQKGAEYKKALIIVGPVGGAKSDILKRMGVLLEGEPLYIPEWKEGSPCTHLCDPLWFLPRSERENLTRALGVELDPDFDICPKCRKHLLEDLDGDYMKVIIIETSFSKRKRGILGRGIAQVTPVEVENADIAVMVGGIALPEIDEKLMADPDSVELTGIYSQGNRGLVEHIEGFIFPIGMLYPLITQTQEKQVGAPGRQAMLWVDTVPILHMNQEVYERFLSDPENKKFQDRIYTAYAPYNLRLDEEKKIYEKLIKLSKFKDFHCSPHTLETVSFFSVATRVKSAREKEDLTSARDPFNRLRVLNGEVVKIPGTTKLLTIADLKQDLEDRNIPVWSEGMDGISYRVVATELDNGFSYNSMRGKKCLDRVLVHRFIIEGLERGQIISKDIPELKRWMDLEELAFNEYKEKLHQDLYQAFIGVKEEYYEAQFQKYIDQCEMFLKSETDKTQRADEEFLTWIDGKKNFAQAMDFRQGVVEYTKKCKEDARALHWWHYQPIKEIIQNLISRAMEKLMRMAPEERLRNQEQKKTHGEHIKVLVERFGYCEYCAPYLWDWYAREEFAREV